MSQIYSVFTISVVSCQKRLFKQINFFPGALHGVCESALVSGVKADRTEQMEKKPVCPIQALFSRPPRLFCFVDLFAFGFHTIESLLNSDHGWALDIIRPCQWTRGTAWDRTPQACCRELAQAECQEWLWGPSGTSLRHLTSA